jgi:8-oxo-dGTP pyrophosphatase MutT (NUDIX family)
MAVLHRSDGDGWVECDCGRRHWGRYGAAGLMLVSRDRYVLLQHRAAWSHQGGTWSLPGGARSSTETALETAVREAAEEAAVDPNAITPAHSWIDDHGSWSYTTVVAHVDGRIEARPADPESVEIRWVDLDEVTSRPLHPAFATAWPVLQEYATSRLVLVVDAANVVGSRPDGWWRDRAGANTRLRDGLATLARRGIPAGALELPGQLWWPDVRMVVEGAARDVSSVDDVEVLAAIRDGDALIVQTARAELRRHPEDRVIAVTADRELRSRLLDLGAGIAGPATLLGLLPPPHGAGS